MQKSFPLITQGSLEKHLKDEGIIEDDASTNYGSSHKKTGYKVLKQPSDIFKTYKPDLFNSRVIFYEPYGDPIKGQTGTNTLSQFRESVLDVAKKYGFPNPKNLSEERKFDFDLSIKIWDITKNAEFDIIQASNEGVWNYLQGYLLPDLVIWRWSEHGFVNRERFLRIDRGTLSSMWWRYYIFTEHGVKEFPDWLHHLTSDDIVQIIERTRVRGYHPIVIPFAKKVSDLRKSSIYGSAPTLLIRSAIKRLRIFLGVKNVWALNQKNSSMIDIVESIFDEAELMLSNNA